MPVGNNELPVANRIARLEAQIADLRSQLASAEPGSEQYNFLTKVIQSYQFILSEARAEANIARAEDQKQAALGQRTDVIQGLSRVAAGYGSAYGNTMKQVGQGNARIAALAASGRGGLNANLNARNAAGLNTTAGTQQATAAREAEKTQARGALGQAIAAGQDYNAAEGQATLDALRNQPAAQPNQAMQLAGQIGSVGQAVWTANQGNQPDPNDKNKTRSGY